MWPNPEPRPKPWHNYDCRSSRDKIIQDLPDGQHVMDKIDILHKHSEFIEKQICALRKMQKEFEGEANRLFTTAVNRLPTA